MTIKRQEQEQQRSAHFESVRRVMRLRGYRESIQTVELADSLRALIMPATLICIICFGIYWLACGLHFADWSFAAVILLLLGVITSVFAHELLHGITWGLLCKNGWSRIRFGILKEYHMPYCHCLDAQSAAVYLVGALMPFFLLGLGLFITSICLENQPLMWLSLFNISSAGGDLLVAWMLRFHLKAVILDHPTECGFVAFIK